jgi:hypothetical protein
MKSFITTIYLHRTKEQNQEIINLAIKNGFTNKEGLEKLRFLGNEVEIVVDILEDGTSEIVNYYEISL